MYTQKPDSHEADTWLTTDAWLVLSIEDSKRLGTSSHNTNSRYGFLRRGGLAFAFLAARCCPPAISALPRFCMFLVVHGAPAFFFGVGSFHSEHELQ